MDIDRIWGLSISIIDIIVVLAESIIISWFLISFIGNKKKCAAAGACFFVVMVVLYIAPWYFYGAWGAYGLGMVSSFFILAVLDPVNKMQKCFLSVIIYLLRWIAAGCAMPLQDLIYKATNFGSTAHDVSVDFVIFMIAELLFRVIEVLLFYVMLRLISRVYSEKNRILSGSELLVMIAPVLAIVLGYWMFAFFSNTYTVDTQNAFFMEHGEYRWIISLYQIISFFTILAVVMTHQRIIRSLQEEKERAVLSGQLVEMQHHIEQVEKMYGEIRGIRHDLAGHMMVIENLHEKQEYTQAKTYIDKLKEQFQTADMAIKTGNPVTDIILDERMQEAEMTGVVFTSDFKFPIRGNVESFDLSIILNNALSNAITAAKDSKKKTVHVRSWMDNNTYLLEAKNSFDGRLVVDDESGLPLTSKDGSSGHGYGLINIRKIAAKYHGDLLLEQEGDEVTLTVLLMVV